MESGRRGGGGGGGKGITLFTAMQLWSAFEAGGVCGSLSHSFSLRHSLYFSGKANSHSRSNFYGT